MHGERAAEKLQSLGSSFKPRADMFGCGQGDRFDLLDQSVKNDALTPAPCGPYFERNCLSSWKTKTQITF